MVLSGDVALQTARNLLQINAIKLSPQKPFTWASGWLSPIYCDNRSTLSFPAVRDYLKSELSNMVRTQYPDAEVIAGVATAGIPHGVMVADALDLPFVYVRNKPKEHGLTNRIEGFLEHGSKVVVVEDLISTGKSSLDAVEALREAEAEVLGLVALFTYGFDVAAENFAKAECSYRTLSDYPHLIEEAVRVGAVSEDELERLNAWREDPGAWS